MVKEGWGTPRRRIEEDGTMRRAASLRSSDRVPGLIEILFTISRREFTTEGRAEGEGERLGEGGRGMEGARTTRHAASLRSSDRVLGVIEIFSL